MTRSISRRGLLGSAAAFAGASLLQARTLKTVGVQLYTVRSVIGTKTKETVEAIEQIGYREAECIMQNLDTVYAALKQTKIKPVSLHLDTAMFMKQQDRLPAALDNAKSKGFDYVVCPYIAPADRGGEDVIRRLGETLNQAGQKCNQNGLKLCYHNHAFEFEPVKGKEGNLLDVLMQTADPKLVSLELDVMWARVAGVDPVTVLQKYPKRVALMHLKDVSKDVTQRYNEGIPRDQFKEVGSGGGVDFKKVLAAASKAGVQHYFVEQDQTAGDPIASLRTSYQYLEHLNF